MYACASWEGNFIVLLRLLYTVELFRLSFAESTVLRAGGGNGAAFLLLPPGEGLVGAGKGLVLRLVRLEVTTTGTEGAFRLTLGDGVGQKAELGRSESFLTGCPSFEPSL